MFDSWLNPSGFWLLPRLTVLGSPVTALEMLAFVLSLAMVVGNLRVKVWAWPLAMAASACYGVLFAASKLYGEAGLQVFFLLIAGWGWWRWWTEARATPGRQAPAVTRTGADAALSSSDKQPPATPPRGVHRMPASWRWRLALGILVAWPALGWLLSRTTDSDVPYADALPTVASVAGQWLLGIKCVENWLVWLGVNLFSIGLFAYKGLWLTAVLYALFAALSWVGWRAWSQQARGGQAMAPADAAATR